MSHIVDVVTSIVTPIVEENAFELVDVEYVKEGQDWFLRIFVDKEGGIDINECAFISERVGEKLDALAEDPFPHAYFLDVSSPGAERPLKKESDYTNALQQFIHLSFYQSENGEKQVQGVLTAFDKETITLQVQVKTQKKEMTFARKNVAKARLAIQF